jgi:hypothetical protein
MSGIKEQDIIAVISSAVAAVSNTTGRKLVVKSIKRVSPNVPVWNSTGTVEVLGARQALFKR